jgi:sulfite dehydrogenase (quinone) subunit SoeA
MKPPYPKPVEAHPTPHFDSVPGKALSGPHLGYVRGPEQLALKADGTAARIDRAFTWENPFSAHGMMHMVIPNAHAGDPYRIDTLFLYMANMAWNSSMNTAAVMKMLTDKGQDGEYVIPRIIYSDAYASEMVAYADLILPDTTYMERHDCISLLDRPISEPGAAGDAIRWPVVEPDRDVRGFQSVLIDLGVRLGLPGFTDDDGKAVYRDYAEYIAMHQRKPGVGPLMGFRGMATPWGAARRTPIRLRPISPMAASFRRMFRKRPAISSPGTRPIRIGRWRWGSTNPRSPICFPLYVRTDAPVPAGCRRAWHVPAARCPACPDPAGDAPVAGLVSRPMAMTMAAGYPCTP